MLRPFLVGACVLLAGAYLGVYASRADDFSARDLAGMLASTALCTGALAAGYAGAMRRLRPALQPEAAPEGRRGTVAGLAAAGVFLTLASLVRTAHPGWSLEMVRVVDGCLTLGVGVVAGAAVAFALFFPWLRPRAERAGNAGALSVEGDFDAKSRHLASAPPVEYCSIRLTERAET